MAIYYFCPDIIVKSAGIRILFRHVEILARHGFPAAVIHMKTGFSIPDLPPVPVKYIDNPGFLNPGDIVVMPEGFTEKWELFNNLPVRRFGIALNWDYVFSPMQRNSNYRALGIERVLTHSPFIGDMISWAMRLPVSVFPWGIKTNLYYLQAQKNPEIVWIGRKEGKMRVLQKMLHMRDPRFLTAFKWKALLGLSEADYAAAVRHAFIFINLSPAEGLPCSLLEAMRCNTLVAGYNSVGGQRELIGSGPTQNAILAETLDYVTLAIKLEQVLTDALKGDFQRQMPILQNAYKASLQYDWNAEESGVVAMWKTILGG